MPKTNLVADDNPAIRKMICKMFERTRLRTVRRSVAIDGRQSIWPFSTSPTW